MFRTLIIALLVAIAVNGVSNSYLLAHIDDGLEEARRQTSSYIRKIETDFNSTNQAILSRTDAISKNVTSYAKDFRDHVSESLVSRQEAEIDFGDIKSRLDVISLLDTEIVSSLDDQGRQINLTDTNVAVFQDLISEVNAKLIELEADLEATRNLNIVDVAVDAYKEIAVYEEDSNLQPCSALPINRNEQASALQAEVENSRAVGIHDINVLFDIKTDGSAILKNMESSTASSRQKRAVSRYINGLRFNEREELLYGCAMIVKLDVRSE